LPPDPNLDFWKTQQKVFISGISPPAGMLALSLAVSAALRLPMSACAATMSPATATSSSRRVLLQRGASAFAAFAATPTFANSDKGYLTMSEYQALKQQALKDERLYGLFEALRTRAAQTSEFTTLADKDDLAGVSKLALAWDSTIRQQTLDEASKQLTGADKDAGAALSKKVLEDLKQLDKLAKEGNKAEVAGATATLKGHVLEFVALEPQRLQDKFGVGDL